MTITNPPLFFVACALVGGGASFIIFTVLAYVLQRR
jgi:hypothetical protein